MALDIRDWLVAFMLLIIILMVLDRMYHDSRWGGYGQSRKIKKEEYIEKHGFIGRRIVQMSRWEGRPPVPESMKRTLQKEEPHDNQEAAYNRNNSSMDEESNPSSRYSERSDSGERQPSGRRDSEDRSYLDR